MCIIWSVIVNLASWNDDLTNKKRAQRPCNLNSLLMYKSSRILMPVVHFVQLVEF